MSETFAVRIARRALDDMGAIFEYIRVNSPQNAAATMDRVLSSIDALEPFPFRYPVVRRIGPKRRSVRRMPIPPFVVYYEVTRSSHIVVVLTVRHGSRRSPRDL